MSTTAHPPADAALTQGMVLVPAGRFTMGDDDYAREAPRRVVDLPAFWIDRHQVTNAQWAAYVADGGHLPAVQVEVGFDCLLGQLLAATADGGRKRLQPGPRCPRQGNADRVGFGHARPYHLVPSRSNPRFRS